MWKKIGVWIVFIACTAIFVNTCIRDINLEKRYSRDFRNRIVGARLEKDGKSPYFYKWRPEDGIRYYDPTNFDDLKVAAITSSPFFHHLLLPLVELPQRTISKLWLLINYFIFTVAVILLLKLCTNYLQQVAVLITAISFLLTEAWQNNITHGQSYLILPFFLLLFYYFINREKNILNAFIAGLFAAAVIFIRPNSIFFFLPFLLMVKHFNKRYLLFFFIPALIIGSLTIASKFERQLWKDYRSNISEQVKMHQNLNPLTQINVPDPTFENWEGWNRNEIAQTDLKYQWDKNAEFANVYSIYTRLFKKSIPVILLYILSVISILILFGWFFFKNHRTGNFTVLNCSYIGCCLYMLTDFFSPICRGQYYAVQWLFPLLIGASVFAGNQKWKYVLLATGILFSIINVPFIKMEHTIGEFIFMFAFILLALDKPAVKPVKNNL